MDQEAQSKIQVRFVTQQRKYTVTDSAILVPAKLRRYGLSEIVNHLLGLEKPIPFDFLIDGQVLRTSLLEYLETAGLSTENVIPLEYVESTLPPTPLSAYQHDDWVSAVKGHNQRFFLTGSYDNNVRIWNASGECLQTFVGHEGPVKSVAWVYFEDDEIGCLSASQDRTIRAWHASISDQKYGVLYECLGHKGSIESIAVNQSQTQFASASWDSSIRLWTTSTPEENEPENEFVQITKKRRKISKQQNSNLVKKSIATLNAHVGPVSSVVFDTKDSSKLYSGGWDHSIRTWDVESNTNIDTKNCDKVTLDVAYSEHSGLIASGHSDRAVRLWDPRTDDSAVVKFTLISHQNWVSAVSWSPESPFMLVSTSYDSSLKIWDIRSKSPLYNIPTNKGQVGKKLFCADWSNDLILCGGQDNQLYIHSTGKINA